MFTQKETGRGKHKAVYTRGISCLKHRTTYITYERFLLKSKHNIHIQFSNMFILMILHIIHCDDSVTSIRTTLIAFTPM